MAADPGIYSAEAGRTWPDWTPIVQGTGEMTTVRTDAPAHQDSAMRLGTVLLRSDGTIWEFALHTEGDPSQGGTLFQLKLTR